MSELDQIMKAQSNNLWDSQVSQAQSVFRQSNLRFANGLVEGSSISPSEIAPGCSDGVWTSDPESNILSLKSISLFVGVNNVYYILMFDPITKPLLQRVTTLCVMSTRSLNV